MIQKLPLYIFVSPIILNNHCSNTLKKLVVNGPEVGGLAARCKRPEFCIMKAYQHKVRDLKNLQPVDPTDCSYEWF